MEFKTITIDISKTENFDKWDRLTDCPTINVIKKDGYVMTVSVTEEDYNDYVATEEDTVIINKAINYNELMMNDVIAKYGHEHHLTIDFCILAELDVPNIYELYTILMED